MRPRQVLPRQFYLITRRCSRRELLLRPDPATNNAFPYTATNPYYQTSSADDLPPTAPPGSQSLGLYSTP
jgi:hypothetical protein